MVLHKYSPQVLEASSYLSLSSLFVLSLCLFVCVLLFLMCSEHADYNSFVVSIQCIICMSYNRDDEPLTCRSRCDPLAEI